MQKKSIYKYASEAGLPAGLYLTIMSFCVLLSVKLPALPLLLFPLMLGFPVMLWILIRKISREEPSFTKFSTLWLGGIYTVIFGSLICTFLSALYVVFFEPNFVNLYVANAIAAVENSAMGSEYSSSIDLMQSAMEAKILPSPLEFLTSMAWFTCFVGSLLSLVIALIMSKAGKNVTRGYSA